MGVGAFEPGVKLGEDVIRLRVVALDATRDDVVQIMWPFVIYAIKPIIGEVIGWVFVALLGTRI